MLLLLAGGGVMLAQLVSRLLRGQHPLQKLRVHGVPLSVEGVLIVAERKRQEDSALLLDLQRCLNRANAGIELDFVVDGNSADFPMCDPSLVGRIGQKRDQIDAQPHL